MTIDNLDPRQEYADWKVPSSAYDREETPDSPDKRAATAKEFIFKLAEGAQIDEEKAVQGIVSQLEGLKNNQNLAAVIDEIDPIKFNSTSKLMDETAKNRLTKALVIFTGQSSH